MGMEGMSDRNAILDRPGGGDRARRPVRSAASRTAFRVLPSQMLKGRVSGCE